MESNKVDPFIVFLIKEAVNSLDTLDGMRASLYIRAANDYLCGTKSNRLDVCKDTYSMSKGEKVES